MRQFNSSVSGVLALFLMVLSFVPLASFAEDKSRLIAQRRTDLAAAYYARGQYGVALEELKTAIDADSDYAPAYSVRALVYMDLKENDEAEKNFSKALKLDEANADTHHNYGWFLCQNEKYDLATKQFLSALKDPLYQTPDKTMISMAMCAEKAGQLAAAEEYYQKSLKIRTNAQALYNLAKLAFQAREYPKARMRIYELNKLLVTPNSDAMWLTIRIEYKLNNKDVANKLVESFRKLFPDASQIQNINNGQFE